MGNATEDAVNETIIKLEDELRMKNFRLQRSPPKAANKVTKPAPAPVQTAARKITSGLLVGKLPPAPKVYVDGVLQPPKPIHVRIAEHRAAHPESIIDTLPVPCFATMSPSYFNPIKYPPKTPDWPKPVIDLTRDSDEEEEDLSWMTHSDLEPGWGEDEEEEDDDAWEVWPAGTTDVSTNAANAELDILDEDLMEDLKGDNNSDSTESSI